LIDGTSNNKIYKTNFAFRLIYNGKILTHLIDGCPPKAELCDVTHFLNLVEPMATRDLDCSVPPVAELPNEKVIVQAKTLMSTTEGVLMFLGLIVVSALWGGVFTFVLLTGHLPFTGTRVMISAVEEDEAGRGSILHPDENDFEDEPTDEDGEFVNVRVQR
jgi:hypothetical protein